MIGKILHHRYKISSLLGEGGMGEVYLATDEQTGQQVAVKVLARSMSTNPDSLERFRREAETLRQLDHPNIVKFVDAFDHEGQYVIVMEYVSGGSLHDLLRSGPLPIERAQRIALELCDALIRSHHLNIVHRDLKPENVLLDRDGKPKLADFGVARLEEGTRMTRTGTQVGTPYYMAPEAWGGKPLDAQADIWSLGIILFEMLAGQVPFGGDTPLAVMGQVNTAALPNLKKLRADAPAGLIRIIKRMLARDKKRRYPTMREVAVDLERIRQSFPDKLKIKNQLGIKSILVLSIIIILVFAWFTDLNFKFSQLAIPNSAEQEPFTASPTLTLTIQTSTENVISTTTPIEESVNDIGSSVISTKDGMALVYVPAGEFKMGSDDGEPDEQPMHNVYLDAFWIDKTEVTNRMYALCVAANQCTPPTIASYFNNSVYADHPVIFINWNNAHAYCAWAERRLPTEAEWEKAARGTNGQTYPWGENISCNDTNFKGVCVGNTSIVASYLESPSPYGVYDMTGNAWEWVYDWYDAAYYQNSPSNNPQGPETGVYRVMKGGSWNSNEVEARAANRSNNLNVTENYAGFRCARSESGIGTTTKGSDGASLVYVPAGEVSLGNNNGGLDEKPVHLTYLDAFWIDQTEVTNSMYEKCVSAGICTPPSNTIRFNDSIFADHPVVYVNWNKAFAYCSWANRRLPSEAEWEKAARGTDERSYPWGEDISCGKANFQINCGGSTTKVKSYINGISIYGAFDMAGNIWEWVNDWHDQNYYQNLPKINPTGPEFGQYRVIRGGSWNGNAEDAHTGNRNRSDPLFSNNNIGFRCALDAAQ